MGKPKLRTVVDRELSVAREAAALAQFNDGVAAQIRSGDFDAWPNVQGALNAVRMVSKKDSM